MAKSEPGMTRRASEFDAEEFTKLARKFVNDTADVRARGRAIFENVGCVKCHTGKLALENRAAAARTL